MTTTQPTDATQGQATNGQAKALPVAPSPLKPPTSPLTNPASANAPSLPVASTSDPMAFAPLGGSGAPPVGASATPPQLASGQTQSPFTPSTPIAPISAPAFDYGAASASSTHDPASLNPDGSIKDPALYWANFNATVGDQNAKQAEVDRINSANSVYNAGGTWDGTDAGRTTVNGLNQGTPYDPTTGTFHGTPGTGTTPGFGVALDGHPLKPGTELPQSAVGGASGGAVGHMQQEAQSLLGGGSTGLTPGGPTDVGGSIPAVPPGTLPVAPTTASNGATIGSPLVGKGVGLTPTTPDNALTNSTISVDPGVDRFAVANDQLKRTIENTLDPKFKADMLAADAHDFGAGRGVSGEHRTSIGNLELAKKQSEDQLANEFLNPALTGTIGDAYANAGIAQQQQGFQSDQQKTGFNQNLTAQQLSDQERQQAFDEALQRILVGSQGDPAALQLELARIFGGESAQDSQAASNLARSVAA